ncbi:MAG: NTP transferase domain-containing protein [Calditrichota bacterium]
MLAIVILAAGKGTRMESDLPKVLHRVNGKPLIEYVLDTAESLNPDRIVAIVGHQRDLVCKQLNNKELEFVIQEPQLGTGHAVQQAEPVLVDFDGEVIVLSGDVPLLRTDTLKKLQAVHRNVQANATVLSTTAHDPKAYGRIVRNDRGEFERIVEEREASDEERKITEINSGVYCFHSKTLFDALYSLKADNSKGEYYLTDVIATLKERGFRVQAVNIAEFYEVRGINTQAELEAVEAQLNNSVFNN